jgi:hypothetical protein
MDDAFDTLKKQHVTAASISGSLFPGRYICPLCQTEVLHVSSDYVSPHFRHRRGGDHEECERYARNFHSEVPLSRHEMEDLDAVLVAFFSESQGHPFVSFAVRFRPGDQVNSVSFTSGGTSTLSTIHHKIQYFRIYQAEETYLVRASLPGGKSVTHFVEGFGETPAVFRANDREAVRLPSHRILRPGVYLVISKASLQHQFHVLLAPESLRTTQGLHATYIKIPEDPNCEVCSNLQSLLGFQTTAGLARYGFIEPMAVSELATDCWEVASNETIRVLIHLSSRLSPKPTRLLVQQRRLGRLSTEYLSLNGVPDLFVIGTKLSPQSPDLYRIGLADPPRFLFEMRASDEPVEPGCARLVFQFCTALKGRFNLTWAAHELPKAFIDVSGGTADLVSIKTPKSIKISASDRAGRLVVIPEVGGERELTNFVRHARFPCVLSATGYPDLTVRRERMASRCLPVAEGSANVVARSRREARLLDAFTRRLVSPYVVRWLT